ncbi:MULTISPECIES: hypothetical protein [Acinetobacter]|uniref:hypothetical protein n=1 Tax=Acinetobacter TaxID=469 RepID=UPI00248A8CDE|nr:hypothetical protein [Acinetobacter sp.]MDI1225332.1 hypothetical protein [Acinetobacter sp.]
MDNIFKIINLLVAILAVLTALITIVKFFRENSHGHKKLLCEDYDGLLLALKNTHEDDSNWDSIFNLAETKNINLLWVFLKLTDPKLNIF